MVIVPLHTSSTCPTVTCQYIWLLRAAAVLLCERLLTPFKVSMWTKLCISFAVWGICIDLCYVQCWLILAPASCSFVGKEEREAGVNIHPWLHWVKLKTEVSRCERINRFSCCQFSYEFSLRNIIELFSHWEHSVVWWAGLKSQQVSMAPAEAILHLKYEWTYGCLTNTKVVFRWLFGFGLFIYLSQHASLV